MVAEDCIPGTRTVNGPLQPEKQIRVAAFGSVSGIGQPRQAQGRHAINGCILHELAAPVSGIEGERFGRAIGPPDEVCGDACPAISSIPSIPFILFIPVNPPKNRTWNGGSP
jgi:hypothetical protein